jgi:NAD(P)-dependent dehydrogenase (short-subunit alcohol dehydrogenase family)
VNQSVDLNGKTAIVTGAGRGLGRWMALGLARAGAQVVVTSRTLEQCQKVVNEIERFGGKALAIRTDVADVKQINAMVESTIECFGKIDILVNNAALLYKRKAFEVDEEMFDQMTNVNVRGAFFCAQRIGKEMVAQKQGKIINLTSAAGKLIRKGLANPVYNLNKGAINMMTKALAEEWSTYNVHVNAIGPGYFETEVVQDRFKDPEVYKSVIESTPLNRIGQEEDLVGVALFLASDASNFMTGQVLYVDGGRTIL